MKHFYVYYEQIGTNNIPSKWPTPAEDKNDAERKFWLNHLRSKYEIIKIVEG